MTFISALGGICTVKNVDFFFWINCQNITPPHPITMFNNKYSEYKPDGVIKISREFFEFPQHCILELTLCTLYDEIVAFYYEFLYILLINTPFYPPPPRPS